MTETIQLPNAPGQRAVILDMVVNGGDPVPLPTVARKYGVREVWTVTNESAVRSIGLRHRHTAVQEDRLGGWDARGGCLYYHGYGSSPGQSCTLVLLLGT